MNGTKQLQITVKKLKQENIVLRKNRMLFQQQVEHLKNQATLYSQWRFPKIIIHLFKNFFLVKVKVNEHYPTIC
jgi:hypothetical protein